MGYISHHAIVVTDDGYGDFIDKAHAYAVELFGPLVSGIITSKVNGNRSFFVAPDGSKEGWDDSDIGDIDRGRLITYLRTFEYEDYSTPLAWVEVQYGDDDLETVIIADSDEHARQHFDEENHAPPQE